MDLWIAWPAYLLVTTVVVYSGSRLSRQADRIAERTGLTRSWLGLLLLAAVTSFPELITGISSVAAFDVPNIAVGDVAGSLLFNLLLFVVLDALVGRRSVYATVDPHHVRTALLVVALTLAGLSSLLAAPWVPTIGWIAWTSPVLLAAYLAALRQVFRWQHGPRMPRRRLQRNEYEMAARFALHALLVIAASATLPAIGKEIAEAAGISTTVVGTIFIAVTTSLPELVITIAAVRIGAPDLAVGNLLGSNLFDIAVLAVDDVFYLEGALMADVARTHALSFLGAVFMSSVVLLALARRAHRTAFLAPESWTLLALYALVAVGLYAIG